MSTNEEEQEGNSAYSDLEQQNGAEEDPFAGVEGVDATVDKLKCTAG